jgi:hypothetical protein
MCAKQVILLSTSTAPPSDAKEPGWQGARSCLLGGSDAKPEGDTRHARLAGPSVNLPAGHTCILTQVKHRRRLKYAGHCRVVCGSVQRSARASTVVKGSKQLPWDCPPSQTSEGPYQAPRLVWLGYRVGRACEAGCRTSGVGKGPIRARGARLAARVRAKFTKATRRAGYLSTQTAHTGHHLGRATQFRSNPSFQKPSAAFSGCLASMP